MKKPITLKIGFGLPELFQTLVRIASPAELNRPPFVMPAKVSPAVRIVAARQQRQRIAIPSMPWRTLCPPANSLRLQRISR